MRLRPIAPLVMAVVVLAACAGDDSANAPSPPSSTIYVASVLPSEFDEIAVADTSLGFDARSFPPLPPTSLNAEADTSATEPLETPPPETTVASTVPPPTTAPRITAPPTTEREPFAVEWNRPSGSFELEPGDVIALSTDGALVLFSELHNASPTTEVLVDDVDVALGGAEIDTVGGVIAGALVVGTCCGDDGGLWSLSNEGGRLRRFAPGEIPAYSAERDWLVAFADGGGELLVHDVPSELVTSPTFEAGAGAKSARSVVWAVDDQSWFVLVGRPGDAGELVQVEARPPFEELARVALDDVFANADSEPVLAGLGPEGGVGVWAREGDEVVLRFLDAKTLKERPERVRTLPATAESVRIGPDGGSLIWIDGTTLHHLPLFVDERVLADGYVAAWFVG